MVGVDGYAGPEAVGAFQPVRLFVYKHGALYGPGEILTLHETTTMDELRREAARLVGIPLGKMDVVQLYVVVDHKYGRITSLQQLCPSDSIVVTTRDDTSESLEDCTRGPTPAHPAARARKLPPHDPDVRDPNVNAVDAAMADSQVFDGSSIYETRPRNAGTCRPSAGNRRCRGNGGPTPRVLGVLGIHGAPPRHPGLAGS